MKRRISVGGFGGDTRSPNVGTDYSFLFMCRFFFAQTKAINTILSAENMDWQKALFSFGMVHMLFPLVGASYTKQNLG